MKETCPLCYTESLSPEIEGPKARSLHFCNNCNLVFEERINYLGWKEEKKRYLEHENGIQHQGYVNHLNQAIKPALKYLKPGSRGLDFGCGPAPTLNKLMKMEGYACEFYDPIFYPEPPLGNFDFVFATECFEHFFRPSNELHKLEGLLNAGGILVVMTQLWTDTTIFKNWRYAHDPTHVVFYHEQTFRYIAACFGFEILDIKIDRVVILQKKKGYDT